MLTAMLIADMLSIKIGTLSKLNPKSCKVCFIQRIWEQQLAAAIYSTSVEESTTLACLREDQDAKDVSRNWQVPDVDLRSNRHPPKSASENPTNSREESAENQRPNSGVNFRYLKMRFTTCLWEVRGEPDTACRGRRRTGCPVASPSGTGESRSCSCTPSGPPPHRPSPHQAP